METKTEVQAELKNVIVLGADTETPVVEADVAEDFVVEVGTKEKQRERMLLMERGNYWHRYVTNKVGLVVQFVEFVVCYYRWWTSQLLKLHRTPKKKKTKAQKGKPYLRLKVIKNLWKGFGTLGELVKVRALNLGTTHCSLQVKNCPMVRQQEEITLTPLTNLGLMEMQCLHVLQ